MSAPINFDNALTHAMKLMADGMTMTEILAMIKIKGEKLTAQIDALTAERQELRKVYAHIDGIRSASAHVDVSKLITNRVAPAQPALTQEEAAFVARAQTQAIREEREMQQMEAAADVAQSARESVSWPAPFIAEPTPKAKLFDNSDEALVAITNDGRKTHVPNGTYTVVMASERRTIKITDHWDAAEKARGTRVAKFLNGPSNESDYVGFAFIAPSGRVTVWKKFRAGSALLQSALAFLLQGDNHAEAGYAYALESGNCWKCNRKLTVPASISRGVGPECAKKLGI